ncbi:SV2-like protein 1 [Operophtera brumata]|uniref:SV2-like protein 1 n=1 Tax=Operophtera brumata TaxID=104452 RepID=A0A0L7L0V3_OPEBR|nr:SV2-like protein 1 [Operophtera brumata]
MTAVLKGIGRYNIKYCLSLALFLVAAIIEPVGYSFVLPAAVCDLDMSIVLTSFPWGYLVDTKGRKTIVIYASLVAGAFSILSAFMPELISFTICKFLTSLCLACPAAVPYTFIGEILPQKYRDLTLSVTNALQITVLAWAIIPLDFRIDFGLYYFRSWRLLVIVYGSFFIIAAFLLSFGPESPKFLMSQGKHDEALKVLQTIYAGNKGKSPEDYPVRIQKSGLLTSLKVQTVPLLRAPYLKLNGLYMWVPDVLNRVMTGSGAGMTACEVIAQRMNGTSENAECIDKIDTITFTINSIANISCAVIAVVVSSSVKIIGKKPLLIIVYLLIGTFCILINFITEDMVFAVLLSSFPIMGLAIGPVNKIIRSIIFGIQ